MERAVRGDGWEQLGQVSQETVMTARDRYCGFVCKIRKVEKTWFSEKQVDMRVCGLKVERVVMIDPDFRVKSSAAKEHVGLEQKREFWSCGQGMDVCMIPDHRKLRMMFIDTQETEEITLR